MELKLRITRRRADGNQYLGFEHVSFTEKDLLEWAKQYIHENFSDSVAGSVDVESIIP